LVELLARVLAFGFVSKVTLAAPTGVISTWFCALAQTMRGRSNPKERCRGFSHRHVRCIFNGLPDGGRRESKKRTASPRAVVWPTEKVQALPFLRLTTLPGNPAIRIRFDPTVALAVGCFISVA
jgi:hypothetical protein